MAKAKKGKAKKKTVAKKKKPYIKGYDFLANSAHAIIPPSGLYELRVPVPANKVILGGGATVQIIAGDVPYLLSISTPIRTGAGDQFWMAVWRNPTDRAESTPRSFTVFATVADKYK